MSKSIRGEKSESSPRELELARKIIEMLAENNLTHRQAKEVLRLSQDVMDQRSLISHKEDRQV